MTCSEVVARAVVVMSIFFNRRQLCNAEHGGDRVSKWLIPPSTAQSFDVPVESKKYAPQMSGQRKTFLSIRTWPNVVSRSECFVPPESPNVEAGPSKNWEEERII